MTRQRANPQTHTGYDWAALTTLRHIRLSYPWAGNIDHVFILTLTEYRRRRIILGHKYCVLGPTDNIDSHTQRDVNTSAQRLRTFIGTQQL